MKKNTPSPSRGQGIELLERVESAAPWQRALVVAGVLVVVLCALVPDIVFQNRIFFVPDSEAPMSFAAVGEKALAGGEYPLWNPYIFCGMPSYASLSFTPYVYPPSFLLFVLQRYLHFPEMTWLLFHYLMAGVGMYLLARVLGARASVSILAGLSFMIMPNFVAQGAYGHGSQACSVAYMPFALLLAWLLMQGYRRLMMAACLAVVLGFQMLRGHVQIAYYTYLLIGLAFAFEAVVLLRAREGRAVLANLGFLALAAACALGIAAVLVVPVHEYAAYSIRGGGGTGGLAYDYATGWSLAPKEMLTFVFPWAFGYGYPTYWGAMPFTNYPNYLGIVTALFGVFGALYAKGRAKWLLVVVVLAATLVSFGKHLPILYGPMFKALPYFNKFRVPVMVLIVQQLAFVALMALGLEELLKRREAGNLPRFLQPARMKWLLIGLAAAVVLVLAASGGIRESITTGAAGGARVAQGSLRDAAASAFIGNLVLTLILALAVCAIVFAAARGRVLAGTVVALLALVAVIDLFVENRNILHPERAWAGAGAIVADAKIRDEARRPDQVTQFLARDTTYFRLLPVPAARIGSWGVSSPLFSENRFMVFGVSSLGGYQAAKLKIYQDVLDAMFASFNGGGYPAGIVDMLNAKYILSAFPLFREGSPFPLVLSGENAYLYENPRAVPRAFFADSVRVLPPKEALAAIADPAFDPGREVILNEAPSIRVESAAGSTARIVSYGLDELAISARVARPCVLVLSEIAYPDWKAEVDGAPARILTADYCLRALPLGPGDHEIRMRFSSRTLRLSLAVSIVCFGAALAPIVLGAAAARRR